MIDTVMGVIKELSAKNQAYEDLLHEKEEQAAKYFIDLFRQAKLSAHCRNRELEKYHAVLEDLLQYQDQISNWFNYVSWDHELETIRWCISASGFEELSIHKTADNFVDYIELYSYGKRVAHCDIPYKKENK